MAKEYKNTETGKNYTRPHLRQLYELMNSKGCNDEQISFEQWLNKLLFYKVIAEV